MGWTYSYNKSELINPLTGRIDVKNYFKDKFSDKYKVIGTSSFVNKKELYTLLLNKETNIYSISVILIDLSSNKTEWGYKFMSEEMEPFYYNCPKKILKIAEETEAPNDESRIWREKCWKNINKKEKIKKIKNGTIIKFSNNIFFTNGKSSNTFIVNNVLDNKTNRKKTYFVIYKTNINSISKEPNYIIKNWKKKDFIIL